MNVIQINSNTLIKINNMFREIKETVHVSDDISDYIRISKDDWYQLCDCDYVLIYDCNEIEEKYQSYLSKKKK